MTSNKGLAQCAFGFIDFTFGSRGTHAPDKAADRDDGDEIGKHTDKLAGDKAHARQQ